MKFIGYIGLLLLLAGKNLRAQSLFLQTTFKGGVSVDGKSYPGMDYSFADTIVFQNSVPAGSIIKKALLISHRGVFPLGQYLDNPLQMIYNGNNIVIDSSNIVGPEFYCNSSHTNNGEWMAVKDVTQFTQLNNNLLITPCQCEATRKYFYLGFLLVILYENVSMPAMNAAIILNDQSFSNNMFYAINGINPISNTNDVGLSIWVENAVSLDKIGFTLNSSLGNFPLGSLWGGTVGPSHDGELTLPGSFNYQNNSLAGLADDTPDAFIDSTDALANIRSYLLNNSNTFSLTATLPSVSPACANVIQAFVLAYSGPCPARGIVPTQSYTLCSGKSLQLQALSGAGSTYVWQPAIGLSDSAIADPLASPPAGTTHYIVQVDSAGCKHTEDFILNVYPGPKLNGISVTDAVCGDTRGSATLTPAFSGTAPYVYDIGNTGQASNYFSSIDPGSYTATITDARGCSFSNTFTIAEINPASVNFTVDPDTLCYGNSVQFTSTSSGITSGAWFYNDTLFSTDLPIATTGFTNTGSYSITLIGWHNQPQCSDTISKGLFVRYCPPDSFSISAPNIFTPNGDGINDVWQPLIYELGYQVEKYQFSIYDRWGLKVFETSNLKTSWDGHTTSGVECSEGTYYFTLDYKASNASNAEKSGVLKGFLMLSR